MWLQVRGVGSIVQSAKLPSTVQLYCGPEPWFGALNLNDSGESIIAH